jgi:hypothetical protein
VLTAVVLILSLATKNYTFKDMAKAPPPSPPGQPQPQEVVPAAH